MSLNDLTKPDKGNYVVDEKRSAVLTAQAKSFPDNTELEAMLNFSGPGEGNYVREVAADPKTCVCISTSVWCDCQRTTKNAFTTYSGGFDIETMDLGPRSPIASLYIGRYVTA